MWKTYHRAYATLSAVFLSSTGFPPIPGVAETDGGSTIAAVLESASKLANMEDNDEEEEVSVAW